MLTRFRRNTAVVVLALSVGALTAACNPVLFTPSGGATNTCPAGNWTLTAESITAPLSTFLGDATISTSGSGVQLVINPSNTWTLTADQTVHVTIATPNVDLTGTVKGTVNGTYSGTGSTISFATTSITGTVQYSGTALGHSISGSIALPTLGNAAQLWALHGSATVACNSDSSLSLTFPAFGLHLHH